MGTDPIWDVTATNVVDWFAAPEQAHLRDADCAVGVCNAGSCVECEGNDDCDSGEVCTDDECVAGGEGDGGGIDVDTETDTCCYEGEAFACPTGGECPAFEEAGAEGSPCRRVDFASECGS